MKNRLLLLATATALFGFIWLGLHNITNNRNILQLKNIQLKSTSSNLKLLQLKYDDLNLRLNNTDKTNTQQIQDLNKQKDDLQQQLDAAQKQLQARADAIQYAASLHTTQTVYAASASCTDAKSCIYMHESHNNPGAINASSGACGIGQAWPCSKLPCSLSDYSCQDNFFNNYAVNRYGSWAAAWAYWQAHGNW